MDAVDLNGGVLSPTFNEFGRSMRINPVLSGMKPGTPGFRVWTEEAMARKAQAGDAQYYFFP